MEEMNEPNEDQEEIKIPLWHKLSLLGFLICSVWVIYFHGMILYLFFLLPFILIMSLIASLYGLIYGEKEDQIFHLISIATVVTLLAIIFKSSTESIFRDEE